MLDVIRFAHAPTVIIAYTWFYLNGRLGVEGAESEINKCRTK